MSDVFGNDSNAEHEGEAITPTAQQGSAASAKPIQSLGRIELRVLGVLIEKAKTTPEQYPLSMNAVVTGSNQKSNRDPVMTLDEEQVSGALTTLRECGAAVEVFGSGRLARYRHLAYEWLGVDKEELAILAELFLRGAQSEGDLRGRASRMDPIADLTVLRAHLDRLEKRRLIVWLSAPGRGRQLTHGLLSAEALLKVQAKQTVAGQAADNTPLLASSFMGEAPAALAVRIEVLEIRLAELEVRFAKLE
ncbi:MAG: DUF480 domain-containing protein [Planctomycetota bacterium]